MAKRDESLYEKIIDYVNGYYDRKGHAPSTREIERDTGISRPTVQRYLITLKERNVIEYGEHRGIVTQYMREAMETNSVQTGNSIPCGPMDEITEQEIETIRLPLALTGQGDFFLLRARGDSMINAGIDDGDLVLIRSMINAGIDDGDLVLIRKQDTAERGKIVACIFEGAQTTLKRLKPEKDAIYLVPENDNMQPIVIPAERWHELRIQGVATLVIKALK